MHKNDKLSNKKKKKTTIARSRAAVKERKILKKNFYCLANMNGKCIKNDKTKKQKNIKKIILY